MHEGYLLDCFLPYPPHSLFIPTVYYVFSADFGPTKFIHSSCDEDFKLYNTSMMLVYDLYFIIINSIVS